jgi:4-amino-4-deoxy-L-arabinose transferase-like glycosyltransferase
VKRIRPGLAFGIGVTALSLVLVAAHAFWLQQESPVPAADESPHLRLALLLRDMGGGDQPAEWGPLFERVGPRPPLYHLLVALGFLVFGISPWPAYGLNWALAASLGPLTWRLARNLGAPAAAPVAGLLVATLPAVTRLAHSPRPDLLLLALVAATVALLSEPGGRCGVRGTALGALLGAGVLADWRFPLFVVGPLVLSATGRGLGDAGRRRGRELLIAAVVGAALASPWWLVYLTRFVPSEGVLVGLGAAPLPPSAPLPLLHFARLLLDEQTSAVLRLALLGTAVHLAWLLTRPAATASRDIMPGRRGLLALLAWVAIPYAVLTAIRCPQADALLPAAPAVVVLAAASLRSIPPRPLRLVALAVVAAYTAAAFGLACASSDQRARLRHALRAWPAVHLALSFDAPEPVSRAEWGQWPNEPLLAAVKRGLNAVAPDAALLLLPESRIMNPDTLTWQARLNGFRLRATSLRGRPPPEAVELDFVLLNAASDQSAYHASDEEIVATAALLARRDEFVDVAELESRPLGRLTLLRSRIAVPPPDLRPPRGEIDLSDPRAHWYLGQGWSFPEASARWALAPEAALRVQLEPGRAQRLVVEMAPYPRLAQPQVVTVRYQGAVVATWAPTRGEWRAWEAEIPGRLVSGGVDELRFSFTQAARPSDMEGSPDTRLLAVFVKRVRFEPSTGSAGGVGNGLNGPKHDQRPAARRVDVLGRREVRRPRQPLHLGFSLEQATRRRPDGRSSVNQGDRVHEQPEVPPVRAITAAPRRRDEGIVHAERHLQEAVPDGRDVQDAGDAAVRPAERLDPAPVHFHTPARAPRGMGDGHVEVQARLRRPPLEHRLGLRARPAPAARPGPRLAPPKPPAQLGPMVGRGAEVHGVGVGAGAFDDAHGRQVPCEDARQALVAASVEVRLVGERGRVVPELRVGVDAIDAAARGHLPGDRVVGGCVGQPVARRVRGTEVGTGQQDRPDALGLGQRQELLEVAAVLLGRDPRDAVGAGLAAPEPPGDEQRQPRLGQPAEAPRLLCPGGIGEP